MKFIIFLVFLLPLVNCNYFELYSPKINLTDVQYISTEYYNSVKGFYIFNTNCENYDCNYTILTGCNLSLLNIENHFIYSKSRNMIGIVSDIDCSFINDQETEMKEIIDFIKMLQRV